MNIDLFSFITEATLDLFSFIAGATLTYLSITIIRLVKKYVYIGN